MDYQKERELICEIGRRVWQRNYCAGNEGNISVRLDENIFLCTPSGVSKGFIELGDLCIVNRDGDLIAGTGRPSSELKMHLAIYAKRPEVNGVVHAHPPDVVSVAIAGRSLPEGLYSEAEVFLGRVPLVPYETLSTQLLADKVAEAVEFDTSTVLMANHGAVTFATDLHQAYYNMEILDSYCRILMNLRGMNDIKSIGAEKMEELMALKTKMGIEDSRKGYFTDKSLLEKIEQFFG